MAFPLPFYESGSLGLLIVVSVFILWGPSRVFASMQNISPLFKIITPLTVFICMLERVQEEARKTATHVLSVARAFGISNGRDELSLKNNRIPNISLAINRSTAEGLSMIEGHVVDMFT